MAVHTEISLRLDPFLTSHPKTNHTVSQVLRPYH